MHTGLGHPGALLPFHAPVEASMSQPLLLEPKRCLVRLKGSLYRRTCDI